MSLLFVIVTLFQPSKRFFSMPKNLIFDAGDLHIRFGHIRQHVIAVQQITRVRCKTNLIPI